MEEVTPLQYASQLEIGSRPVRRHSTANLSLDNLRAIPFVGAWSQMKQNIPGFYGIGSAVSHLIKEGKLSALQELYQQKLFFRTLIDNAMQVLTKTFLPLTQYLKDDEAYGALWRKIANETQETVKDTLLISGQKRLLESDPHNAASIALREKMIMPLLVIQQYAMLKKRLHKGGKAWEKVVLKAIPAIINAGRNAA